MSSAKHERKPASGVDAGSGYVPAANVRPATERTGSIARSISWSYWWRRTVSWIVLDILLVAAVLGTFCYGAVQAASGDGSAFPFFAVVESADGQSVKDDLTQLAEDIRGESGTAAQDGEGTASQD